MYKNFNLLNNNKFIFGLIIPLILLAYYISMLSIKSSDNFSNLTFKYDKNIFKKINTQKLLRGEKATGEFYSFYPNLGIVSIKFDTNNRSVNDVINFRIKERNSKNWYYENNYLANQFQNNRYFPFGFPVLKNSAGKKYVFEIKSLNGTEADSIKLSSSEALAIVSYHFSNWKKTPLFFILKPINALATSGLIINLYYLLPFIFYIFMNVYLKNKISNLSKIGILFLIVLFEQGFKLLSFIGILEVCSLFLALYFFRKILFMSIFYYLLSFIFLLICIFLILMRSERAVFFSTTSIYILFVAVTISLFEIKTYKK